MKTIGIIAEYNPFHGGHLYQLQQARERFHADFVVVAMSGDFVQRGEPAVYDKYIRTEIALAAGADLVLELPVFFSCSSAEDFAAAGVALLDRLGVVDTLCFGSELGELAPLLDAAKLLVSEPKDYKRILQECLKSGDSFPKARARALSLALSPTVPGSIPPTDLQALLSSPNNILGIEYLKALLRRNSRIEPATLRRTGQGYHDSAFSSDCVFPSASALRHGIRDGIVDYFQQLPKICTVPDVRITESLAGLASKICLSGKYCRVPVFADDLSLILNWRLLELVQAGQTASGRTAFPTKPTERLTGFADVSPELAARLAHAALDFETFTGRIRQLKTRQYTYTRISRALLHILLGITGSDIALAKGMDYVPYVRILGFRRSAKKLLARIKQDCCLPLITKTADARKLLDNDGLKIFEKDLQASHLRQTLAYHKSGQKMVNEYTHPVTIRPE